MPAAAVVCLSMKACACMQIIEDYRQATHNALEAGFDGVELHSGNVTLLSIRFTSGVVSKWHAMACHSTALQFKLKVQTLQSIARVA